MANFVFSVLFSAFIDFFSTLFTLSVLLCANSIPYFHFLKRSMEAYRWAE